MRTMVLGVIGLAAGTLISTGSTRAAAPRASGSPAWLHVRVEEPAKDTRVSVNLPMSVVEAALSAAPEKIVSDGRVHLGVSDKDLKISDLRNVWRELKNAGDTEIVTVEEGDERVNVSRKGDLVLVRVQDLDSREEVHVDIPVAVVDALFQGEGEALDLKAGAAALRGLRGDIVRVKDKETSIRIWIDEGN